MEGGGGEGGVLVAHFAHVKLNISSTYLLCSTMSGAQISSGLTRILSKPPKSFGDQIKKELFQLCKIQLKKTKTSTMIITINNDDNDDDDK